MQTASSTTTSPIAPLPPALLWAEGAPGALGTEPADQPTLTAYLPNPARASGAALVICPGGGYGHLAEHEGAGYAEWLAAHGIAGLVLKYRLGERYRHPSMLQDVSRAMRLARHKAGEWKLDADRIGVMGSSAGGHLAASLLTHSEDGQPNHPDPVEHHSSHPALGILCYAVISMGEHTHHGSRHNLLGPDPDPALLELLSNELHVTPQTPPCFLWHTWEDKGVKLENSLDFVAALQRNDVPFDFHVYQQGGHGLGLGDRDGNPIHPWAGDCLYWLKAQNFLK